MTVSLTRGIGLEGASPLYGNRRVREIGAQRAARVLGRQALRDVESIERSAGSAVWCRVEIGRSPDREVDHAIANEVASLAGARDGGPARLSRLGPGRRGAGPEEA